MEKIFKHQRLDAIILLLIPILGACATLFWSLRYLNSILIFLGFPILYLAFKVPRKTLWKSGLYALIFSLPLSVIVDYMVTIDEGWFVPDSIVRFFDVVPIEDLIFGFLSVWAIVIIYEYFVDKNDKRICEPKMKYLVWLVGIAFLLFVLMYVFFPVILVVPYAFLIICSIFLLLPLILMLTHYPRLAKKYMIVAGYFFFVSLCWELSALYTNQWFYFGKHYVGWLQIFHLRMPIEEFIFFWIIYAAAILSWYEFFDDDCK